MLGYLNFILKQTENCIESIDMDIDGSDIEIHIKPGTLSESKIDIMRGISYENSWFCLFTSYTKTGRWSDPVSSFSIINPIKIENYLSKFSSIRNDKRAYNLSVKYFKIYSAMVSKYILTHGRR